MIMTMKLVAIAEGDGLAIAMVLQQANSLLKVLGHDMLQGEPMAIILARSAPKRSVLVVNGTKRA